MDRMNRAGSTPNNNQANMARSSSVSTKAARGMSQRIGTLVRTASFAGPRGPRMNSSNDDSQNLLGGRRETMKVNFPGAMISDSVAEVDDDTVILKIKEPKLTLARGNEVAKNLICQPHDGLRMELKQMYTFLKTWKTKDFDIAKSDLIAFYTWWDGYKTCHFDFFTIEEKVVYAWIESKVGMPKGMHVRERMVEKLDIIVWGQEIDKLREKFDETKRPRDYMSTFLEAIENFVVKSLQYFNKKERILPAKLKESVPEARWPKLEKKIVEEIIKTKQPELLLIVYMNQAKDTDAWKKSCLTFRQRTKFGRWSSKYDDHLHTISL